MPFYALKDNFGFPIPGTMIRSLTDPGAAYIKLKNEKTPATGPCFNIGGGVSGVSNPGVFQVKAMSNGDYVIAGNFTQFSDILGTQLKLSRGIMRLDSNGLPIAGFTSQLPSLNNGIKILGVDNSGNIFISPNDLPNEVNYDGAPFASYIIKINGVTGARDNSFNAPNYATFFGQSIIELADGKLLFGNNRFRRIAVLNADGTSFNEGPFGTTTMTAPPNILKLSNGKIVLYGNFQWPGNFIYMASSTLVPDGTFNVKNGFNGAVTHVSEMENGQLLVCGSFTSHGGFPVGTKPRVNVAILNPDGSLDESFSLREALSDVPTFAYQIGSRIYIGSINTYGTKKINKLVAVDRQGYLDQSFSLKNVGSTIDEYANPTGSWDLVDFIKEENKILLAGTFNEVNGKLSTGLVRIDQDGDPDDCSRRKFIRRHPRGLRYFIKISPTGEPVPNSLIASKVDPGYAHEEIQIVQ